MDEWTDGRTDGDILMREQLLVAPHKYALQNVVNHGQRCTNGTIRVIIPHIPHKNCSLFV